MANYESNSSQVAPCSGPQVDQTAPMTLNLKSNSTIRLVGEETAKYWSTTSVQSIVIEINSLIFSQCSNFASQRSILLPVTCYLSDWKCHQHGAANSSSHLAGRICNQRPAQDSTCHRRSSCRLVSLSLSRTTQTDASEQVEIFAWQKTLW